jgi:3-oxoacyl-[acyl-carrier protein] reductase
MISLAGRAALITGGSRGIGAATVRLFAQAGADVVFSYNRSREVAHQLAQEASKHGTRVEAFPADLRRMAKVKELVDFARERLGRVDILVANAGIWNPEDVPIERLPERQWDEMMRINLKSVYSIIHFTVPLMIQQRSGRIIALSSTAGQRGEAFHAHYAASKGAIISLVKGLSTELARYGILVNCVAPGWVDTPMSRPALATKPGRKFALAQIPLGRVAAPEEVAGPILFLASDLATFITGEVLNVNGGSVLCG